MPNSRQLTRIILVLGLCLVLGSLGFGAYYYSQRYMSPVKKVSPDDQALIDLGNAVRKDPTDVQSRAKLAETYLLNRRFDEAIAQSNKILEAYPENESAMLTLGVAYIYTQKFTQAIPPLEKFISIREKGQMPNLDTSLESALYFSGMAYIETDQAEKGVTVLSRALGMNATDADATYQLGRAYARSGKHEQAIHTFEIATLFVPDYTAAYQGMLDSYLVLKDQTRASYARGMVAYSIKDYQTATSELERVVLALPDFVPAYIGLGMSYEALGDLDKAAQNAKKALELDPQNPTAQRVADEIQSVK